MDHITARAAPSVIMPLVIIALIATVVTQVLYIGLGVSGTPAAMMLWRSEAVAFLAIALLGFAWMRDWPLVSGALVLGGVFSFLQIGIGLTLFGALEGEAMAGAMGGVLGLAFFLYHAGKVGFALAAIGLGVSAWQEAKGWPRIVGLLAGLTGIAALATNLFVIAGGSATFVAGACGTAATLLLALTLGSHRPRGQ